MDVIKQTLEMPQEAARDFGDEFALLSKCFTVWIASIFGFSVVRIFPDSNWIQRFTLYWDNSLYSVQMWENTDQKNSEYGHFHAVIVCVCVMFQTTYLVLLSKINNHFLMFAFYPPRKYQKTNYFFNILEEDQKRPFERIGWIKGLNV